jgi:uncharacterized protein
VRRLRASLAELERAAVALSGGVDSAVLLHAARAVLGARAFALVADSPSLARRELGDARALALALGAELVELRTEELSDPRYAANAGDRCYWCKSALFEAMEAWAVGRGGLALLYGEIADDLLDERPGRRAARERGVRAPLAEAGFTKEDVRRYAREHGLAVAEKPAAACLASRLPVGRAVTREALARVEEAEERVRALGLAQVRVRDHGARARLEVGREELARARSLEAELARRLAPLGFASLELAAYVPPAERA